MKVRKENLQFLPRENEILGTFSNKDSDADPDNDGKELGTCADLSLKLEREKTFYGVLRTTRT